MNCINSGGKPLPMSAATAITTQNPSPLRRKTFYFCVLRRPSRFCPSGNSSQNTHCETQANLRCSGLNTDFLRCTAFREYPRAERSITRRRAKHPNTPSAQPIRLSRLNAGLLRTSSKIERRFKWGNMAVREGFEPSVRNYPYGGLANRWFQPLTHLTTTKDTLINANRIPRQDWVPFLRHRELRLTLAGEQSARQSRFLGHRDNQERYVLDFPRHR